MQNDGCERAALLKGFRLVYGGSFARRIFQKITPFTADDIHEIRCCFGQFQYSSLGNKKKRIKARVRQTT